MLKMKLLVLPNMRRSSIAECGLCPMSILCVCVCVWLLRETFPATFETKCYDSVTLYMHTNDFRRCFTLRGAFLQLLVLVLWRVTVLCREALTVYKARLNALCSTHVCVTPGRMWQTVHMLCSHHYMWCLHSWSIVPCACVHACVWGCHHTCRSRVRTSTL